MIKTKYNEKTAMWYFGYTACNDVSLRQFLLLFKAFKPLNLIVSVYAGLWYNVIDYKCVNV